MKKIFLKTIAIILSLAMIFPVFANAATLTIDRQDGMKVGETVKITVTMEKSVSNMQFDIKFDNTKYQYVPNSAKSALESTYSSLIKKDTVRVSAVDYSGKSAKTVTLEFKAINVGEEVPFTIEGIVELGENGEQFDEPTIKVSKIGAAPQNSSSNIGNESSEDNDKNANKYINEDGEVIKTLPQTGSTNVGDIKSLGVYTRLIFEENQGYKLVVPYALSNSDQTVSVNDIKNEFGEITTSATNAVKTGDKFNKDGNPYTVIIYGDFNADGKITTLDALEIGKYLLDDATNSYTKEQKKAADVLNDGEITKQDAIAIQKFIVGNGTIINNAPAKIVGITENGTSAINGSIKKTLDTKTTTIIPMQLIDQKGKTSKILNKDINTDVNKKDDIGTISILEKDYEDFTGADITITKYISNGQGRYEVSNGLYQSIDGIGIEINSDALDLTSVGKGKVKDRLEKGLVITYDSVDTNGNICRKSITIDITVNESQPTTDSKQAQIYTLNNVQTNNKQNKEDKTNADKAEEDEDKEDEDKEDNANTTNTTNNIDTNTNTPKTTNLVEPKVVENKTSEE